MNMAVASSLEWRMYSHTNNPFHSPKLQCIYSNDNDASKRRQCAQQDGRSILNENLPLMES